MTAATSKLQILGRLRLIGLCCAIFAMGCQPSSTPSANDEPGLQTNPPNQILEPESAATLESSTNADNQPSPAPSKTKPLDLSRNALDSLKQATADGAEDSQDPNNLLPDLFEDKSTKSGARASGRVLMREDEKASMQSIEGVELKLEVPIN